MIELAINLETIYPGMDFCDKIRGVHRAGFRAIEFWGWQDKNLEQVKRVCRELDVQVQAFSGTGSWSLCDRTHRKEYMEWISERRIWTGFGRASGPPRSWSAPG